MKLFAIFIVLAFFALIPWSVDCAPQFTTTSTLRTNDGEPTTYRETNINGKVERTINGRSVDDWGMENPFLVQDQGQTQVNSSGSNHFESQLTIIRFINGVRTVFKVSNNAGKIQYTIDGKSFDDPFGTGWNMNDMDSNDMSWNNGNWNDRGMDSNWNGGDNIEKDSDELSLPWNRIPCRRRDQRGRYCDGEILV